MLTVVHWLSAIVGRAQAARGNNADFPLCLCFSLLGLVISLAFLNWYGPDALVLLAGAN